MLQEKLITIKDKVQNHVAFAGTRAQSAASPPSTSLTKTSYSVWSSYNKTLCQHRMSQFSPSGEKIRSSNQLLKRISAEGKPILTPYRVEKTRIWSQGTLGKLQQHSAGAPVPHSDPLPWQQGQSCQKRSHWSPLRLSHQKSCCTGVLYLWWMRTEQSVVYLVCLPTQFSCLAQYWICPKQSCLWKVDKICSSLHLLAHATEISPADHRNKTSIYKNLFYFITHKLNASWVKKNLKKQSIAS